MMPFLRKPLFLLLPLVTGAGLWMLLLAQAAETPKTLHVLLVAGGCCHDYATQTLLLKEGIEARLKARVEVVHNPDKTTKATFGIYNSADWAKGYDVVIHDECSADVTDPAYVKRILDAHRNGVPAVNLHCAMHSYRWGNFREPVAPGADNAGWYEMLGLQSTGHGPQSPIEISYVDAAHPIATGLAGWTTVNEELYNNIQILTGHAIAKGRQLQKPRVKPGEPEQPAKEVEAVVAWTNEFGPGKTRIFSTTIGHNNDTVGDARYLDLVCRGLLWATGNLGADGKPTNGLGR
jgi:type 1 glutamine amidotransferase